MSKYSSDSDNDYRRKNSRRKRYRSDSSSSRDSYGGKSSRSRRYRKSRSRSRDRLPLKNKHSSDREKNHTRRSRSRNRSRSRRRNQSISRSRSRSRTSSSSRYKKRKAYSTKSKKSYKSRSRSRSYHRKSRSRSRKRYHRSRSRSSSYKRSRRSADNANNDSSNSPQDTSNILNGKHLQEAQKTPQRSNDAVCEDSKPNVVIPSDDPIVKQEQLDDINSASFVPKPFKSSRQAEPSDQRSINSGTLGLSIKAERELTPSHTLTSNVIEDVANGRRKNETVFHDSIVFEDSELKIQKWIKKLHTTRQKYLFGYPQWNKTENI